MLDQQALALRIQQQVSSGKRVLSPSDDPIAAAQISLMKQRVQANEGLEQNRQSAEFTLKSEESIISSAVGIMQKLRTLQIQAGNPAMTEDNRKSMATEAQVLLNQLNDLANSKDENGNYLFAGSKTTIQPFTLDSNGNYVYNGDETDRYQDVSNGIRLAVNDNGSDLFMRIPGGNGQFSIGHSGAANTGTAVLDTGSVTDPGSYVADNYTLSFAKNSANQLVVMVTGANSGNVLPASGLADDAPVYQEGMSVNFNGMGVKVTGAPNEGDSFTLQPKENMSIFATVQAMIDNLKQPFTTPADKASVQTENNQVLSQLDASMAKLINAQSDLGARLQQLDMAKVINKNAIDEGTIVISQLEDVDMTSAIANLNQQILFLQAAQGSFAKIQSISALDYMR